MNWRYFSRICFKVFATQLSGASKLASPRVYLRGQGKTNLRKRRMPWPTTDRICLMSQFESQCQLPTRLSVNSIDEATSTEFSTTKMLNPRRVFAICNALLVLLFVVGNAFIPGVFWDVGPDSPIMLLSVFVSGALAMQIAMMGLYGGLYDQFILVRLTWSTLGVTASTLFISVGVQITDSSFLRQGLDVELTLLLLGIGFGCFVAILAVCLLLRMLLHYRLVHGVEEEIASRKSFGIAFLMKLTTAIACLLIGSRMLSMKLATSSGVPIIEFSAIAALTLVLVGGLIAGALKLALANDGNSKGLLAIVLLLLIGSPTLVCLCTVLFPNSWSFGWQLLGFVSFLSGLTSSLLGVLYLWRKIGVRMVHGSMNR